MKVGIKSYSYCLNHAPENGSRYGGTPYEAFHSGREQEYLDALPKHLQSYDSALHYAPNQTYIGGISYEEFEALPSGWINNPLPDEKAKRYGKFGELIPEDEFLGLISACDEFELVWLEKSFAEAVSVKLAQDPVITEAIIKRVIRPKNMHELSEIDTEVKERAGLYLYHDGKPVGCIRSGHPTDPCLTAHVLLENLAGKASGVLALLHLLKNSGLNPGDLDFVIECSEEGAGDVGQRAGGNFAKAIAEVAGCVNASGCDVRGFCAGPVNAMINAAAQVASGARKNIAVVAGGSIPKLYMNSRDHVKKNLTALEDCVGSFAVLLVPDDGVNPVMRLDVLGKHTVGAGGAPQAVTSALTFEPLQAAGLSFADVDRYAPELQNHEITEPAGAGNVPLANIKMIAALAVMKKAIEKADMMKFIKEHGTIGYAPTQGHIPAGVPFIGHACEMIKEGKIKRSMIIGKGSLFLARLTNLADGASFLIEAPEKVEQAAKISKDDIKALILEALGEVAGKLSADLESKA
ncbi:MAG: glycine reductase [Synergistaceae bacterium]|nr:glycine reductase [Synergistaceae bacterium]